MTDEMDPAELPDGEATEQPDQGVNPDTMPLDALRELIRSGGVTEAPPAHEPPAPEIVAEPEPEPEPSEPPPTEPEPPPEPSEAELKELRLRLELDQLRAKYEKLEQHSGRLAGEVGYLRKQRQSGEASEIAAELDPEHTSELARRIEEIERRTNMEAATRAIAEEVGAIGNRPELQALKLQEEMAQAAQKYSDRWQEILKIEDPSQARMAAKEMAIGIVMDAIGLRLSKKPAVTTSNEARVVERKLAVSASGATGARIGARPKLPDPKTMPLDQLKKMIEDLGGAG